MKINQTLIHSLMSDFIGESTGEMIPLLSPEEEMEMINEEIPETLPILPIRNTVLFPGVVIPITVGRQKSINLVREANQGDKTIGVVAQVNPEIENPTSQDLSQIGTVAKIVKMLALPDGNTTIIIQGKRRFVIDKMFQEEPYFKANVSALEEDFEQSVEGGKAEVDALMEALKDTAKRIIGLSPEIPVEARVAIDNIETPGFLTHFLCSNLNVNLLIKQNLLEIQNGIERATKLLEHMNREVQLLELKTEIQTKVHTDIDQQQRDFFLRQQMKVLQDELGEEGPDQEIERLKVKASKKKWSKEVAQHFDKELTKISRMNPAAADFPVSLNYAEFLVDLPWDETSKDNFDLKRAKRILDKDHHGLEKVKQRILEYLAVVKLKRQLKGADDKMRGPILCLYGPPGVGKTSLGKSIARALDRQYVRMSLGGVHDESEIRGHRKTYVGAMPGKVIQNIKKAETSNPVFVLDEIDKVASDFRGDPSSALLEVLDPEQNDSFIDNYLEIEYDLSKSLFIATSNSLDTIQPALRDRMEIIELTGYTLEEKVEIVKRHLIPRQLEEHGLDKGIVTIAKPAIVKVIEEYTRESGVRSLERKIGAIFRYVAKSIALEEEYPDKIKAKDIPTILGAEVFEKETYEENEIAGIVTGLAWTPVGGEILSIESILSRGKGKLTLSGQLGDVMKESAMAALSNLRAHAEKLSIDYRIFDQYDLHIHFPAGAVPKDGPSAGITIYTSLASLYTQRKVRPRLAMTGEITLSGKVLPVGGIKEKVLAAKRAGITDIIMCAKNSKDINEISEHYLEGLTIHYVRTVREVIDFALLDEKVINPLELRIEEEKKNRD